MKDEARFVCNDVCVAFNVRGIVARCKGGVTRRQRRGVWAEVRAWGATDGVMSQRLA